MKTSAKEEKLCLYLSSFQCYLEYLYVGTHVGLCFQVILP